MKTQDENTPIYSIGSTARMLGVSVQTLRLYEAEGLVLPAKSAGGQRRYSPADIKRLECVRQAITEQKMGIAGIRHMLAMIPCWRIKNCPEAARTSCPAFSEHDTPCWIVTNKSWECKNSDCRQCAVYKEYSDCRSVKRIVAECTLPAPHLQASDPSHQY